MTTDSSGTLWVSTRNLEVGLARKECPNCGSPLLIRLPSMQNAIKDRQSDALRLGMIELTPSERRIFDAIYAFYPNAGSVAEVLTLLGDMGQHGLESHIWRMRQKLRVRGWQLATAHRTLRLIEPA